MDTIAQAISDLTYAFEQLQQQLAGLTEKEATTLVVDDETGLNARQMLAHLTGWEDYVLEILPELLASIDVELPPVDVERRNRAAVRKRAGHTTRQILAEFQQKHHQIMALLQSASPQQLVMRRTRGDKIFTIKSYVVDVLQQHILDNVQQLKLARNAKLPHTDDTL